MGYFRKSNEVLEERSIHSVDSERNYTNQQGKPMLKGKQGLFCE